MPRGTPICGTPQLTLGEFPLPRKPRSLRDAADIDHVRESMQVPTQGGGDLPWLFLYVLGLLWQLVLGFLEIDY